MKTKYFYAVLIVVLFAAICLLYVSNRRYKASIDSLRHRPYLVENNLLKEGFFHSYDFENLQIETNTEVFSSSGDSVTLANLVADGRAVFLFAHTAACGACSFDNIDRIMRFSREQGFKVLIGIAGMSEKDFSSYVQNNGLEEIAFRLPSGFFREFEISPVVYFVMEPDGNVHYFYAPSNLLPELTSLYFEKIQIMCR